MSKNIKLLTLMFLISFAGIAQVGIGTITPDASSALDVTATDKGFLMPRMTTTQKNAIAAPAEGLQVYDTDTKSIWTFDGTNWTESSGGGKFIDGATPDIAYYEGKVGIGRNAFSDAHKLYVENTMEGGQNNVLKVDGIFQGTGTATSVYGITGLARNTGTGSVGTAIGIQGFVNNQSGGNMDTAAGSWPEINNSSTIGWASTFVGETKNNSGGTMTQGLGESINLYNETGATMGEATISSMFVRNNGSITGDAYGLWIGGTSTGSVGGNSYALYIATPFTNITGNNFALYSDNTADSYMEGNLGVGTSTPLRKVHISGAMRLQPQATAPTNGALGDLYVGTDGNLYFHDGNIWRTVQLVP